MITRIKTGSIWEDRIGYARAVVAGGWVHVSGTTGTDHATGEIPVSIEDQCKLALSIIDAALARAGAGFEHAVRVTYVLKNAGDFERCWPILAATFGANPPAAMMIEAPLIDPRHLIEIELTAYLGDGAQGAIAP
ncbi:MAG: RidA family protein [Cypionkella sp.]|nr:RidA family protein [Cypionkella sp.]